MTGDLPFNAPKKQSGRVILLARVKAKPGQGDAVADHLKQVRARAESSSEPGTHTYRTTRSEQDSDTFIVFEEYDLPQGIKDHVDAEPFQKLAASGLVADLVIEYFDEIKA